MLRLMRALRHRVSWRDESGAIAIIVALTMVVVLGMAALVIDVGALQAKRAQLQEAADAAALALAQGCLAAPATTTAACSGVVTSTALATATQLALANVNDDTVTVAAPVFTASTVRVSVTSTEQAWFSQIFGISSSGVAAAATAKWSPPVIPLPLAYHECALPAVSSATVLLRSDVLALPLATCGLTGSVTGILGASWAGDSNCSFDVNLLTYVGGVLSNVLPANCVSKVTALIGKQVLLPVYDHVLGPIVINGVLLGNGYKVEKYALVTVSGYDFQSLNLAGISLGGPKNISGSPQCPTTTILFLTIEEPLCQGIQGKLTAYLTPDEAAQRLTGVQLIN